MRKYGQAMKEKKAMATFRTLKTIKAASDLAITYAKYCVAREKLNDDWASASDRVLQEVAFWSKMLFHEQEKSGVPLRSPCFLLETQRLAENNLVLNAEKRSKTNV
jgi:hypothetical protein